LSRPDPWMEPTRVQLCSGSVHIIIIVIIIIIIIIKAIYIEQDR